MASTTTKTAANPAKKAEAALLRDIRQGNAKKREAATRKLGATDPAQARAILLEVLEETKKAPSRAVIVRCLHWVANAAVARMIVRTREFDLLADRLPEGALIALYDDLRAALLAGSLREEDVRDRLSELGLLAETIPTPPSASNAWSESVFDLLLTVVDTPRLLPLRADAARGIQQINLPRAHQTLLARWEAEPVPSRAFDAYAAWIGLGCPVNEANRADRMMRLFSSLLEELRQPPSQADTTKTRYDDLFATPTSVLSVPEMIVSDFFLAVANHPRFPKTKVAIGKRLVDITRSVPALVKLLDDQRFETCHKYAAEALAKSVEGARALLLRSDRVPRAAVAEALARLPPEEAYDFVAPRFGREDWYATVVAKPTTLRDPRWIELAQKTTSLEDQGRGLFLAVAKDPHNEMRAWAVKALSQAAARATDRLERRNALYALGQTKHPNATPALVEALDDPEIGDAVPLVCTALGECGDTRAIKILETRVNGPHGRFVQSALDFIRGRMTQIHADVLLAACQDDDVVIADLARRAREGDQDSAIVLEDALRERGRL